MKPRFVFIHGNSSTHWSFGWAPWFKEQLERLGFEVFFETMPDSIIARSQYWIPFLKEHVKVGENDVLVGWSSGATAAMRYVEKNKILGSVLISPSYTDLDDELEKQSGYFDQLLNWVEIKNNQHKIALFYGDNDPYIPQEEFEFIAQQLSPTIFKIPGSGHFEKQQDFPQLIAYVKKTYLS
jgi:predicted alpha/beta hydrolase family esterase